MEGEPSIIAHVEPF